MATHDYVLANASGAAFRADLNNALAAIVSNNSSATEPATTYAYMWWADTTAGQLKLRNAANDDWIVIQELDGTLLIEDGTVSDPGLAFADDLDTGLFRPAANQLAITTNGVERIEFGISEVVVNDGGADVDFRVEGDTEANLLVVDAGNDRIGIAESAPGTLVEIGGETPYVTLKNSTEEDTDGGRESRLIFEGEQSGGEISSLAQIEVSHDGTADDEKGKLIISTNDGSDGAAPTAAVTIDSNQRLLVGTDASRSVAALSSQLFVEGTTSDASSIGIAANTNDTSGSFLALGKSRGTADGANTIVQNGDSLGQIRFAGADGTDLATEAARITAQVDGTPGANDMPGRLMFSTTADGASTPTERMRITSDGNLGIGSAGSANTRLYSLATGIQNAILGLASGSGSTYGVYGIAETGNSTQYGVYGKVNTSSTYSSGGILGYSINDNTYGIVGYWDTAAYWSFYGNGACGATAFTNVSDSRLKDVDSNLTGCLDKLASIQPVKYTWKENSQQRRSMGDGLEIGLLAEEVQAQFPELVSEMEWGEITGANPETLNEQLGTTLGVDYGRMTAVLIQALNEAKTRIETLETKVAALEAQ